jgi:integrase
LAYADRTRRPPRTLTDDEQRALLKASGKHADTFRDHLLFSLALGTALREGELAALDLEDVRRADGKPKRSIQLRHFARKGRQRDRVDAGAQVVHLPDSAFYKLEKALRRRRRDAPTAPLFVGRGGGRLSTRRMREIFAEWQERAGLERRYTFHELRHTAITNAYRATRDIRIAQRVARHARVDTTTRYEHASDQEVAAAVRKLPS